MNHETDEVLFDSQFVHTGMCRAADESEASQYLVELVVPDLGSLFLPVEVPDHLDSQSFASGARNHPLWHHSIYILERWSEFKKKYELH